jgi:hypothetical protein
MPRSHNNKPEGHKEQSAYVAAFIDNMTTDLQAKNELLAAGYPRLVRRENRREPAVGGDGAPVH